MVAERGRETGDVWGRVFVSLWAGLGFAGRVLKYMASTILYFVKVCLNERES